MTQVVVPAAKPRGNSFRDKRGLLGVAFALSMFTPVACIGQAQTPPADNPPIVKAPPVPTGVIPLPAGPPPTGLQAPLPAPAIPIPPAKDPLLTSPGLAQLNSYLQTHPLTINDAVAIAEGTSRPFATAVEAMLRAQGRYREAQAALVPNFTVGANVTEYDASTVANFGGQQFTLLNQFNPIMNATVSVPLDVSGTIRAAVSQAEFQRVAAQIDVNRVRNQLVLDVKTAFYNVLRAQAQQIVASDTLNNALNRLSDAQKNYAAGTAPRFDVITAQRDVADAQQGIIQTKSQVSLNLALLKSTIGLNIRTPLRISDQGAVASPPDVAPLTVPAPAPPNTPSGASGPVVPLITPAPLPGQTANSAKPGTPTSAVENPQFKPEVAPNPGLVEDPIALGPDFDAVVQEAQRTRPEIMEAEADVAAARKGIQVAWRSSLPSVTFSLGYVYEPYAPAGFARVNQGEAILGVTVPVFDGGVGRARVEQARADVATAETNRRNAVDQVNLEVQQAYLALLQARDRVAVANVGLAQAQEAARLARVRYDAGVSIQQGVSPILELSSAQTTLAQAENNQVNALYDYNNARAQLDRAVGRYAFTTTGPGYITPPQAKTTGANGNRH